MISVIVPCYNVERYIYSCLSSIENQIYRKFEIIAVNDGSTDKTLEIIKAFKEKSKSKVIIISQNQSGVSAARNTGLKYSSGEYVCFVDADDMIEKEYLMYQSLNLKNNQVDLAVCSYKGIVEAEQNIENIQHKNKIHILNQKELLTALLYHKVKVCIGSVLIRREILTDICFSHNKKYSEDLEFIWKVSAKVSKSVVSSAPLYNYRVRSGSAMCIVDKNRYDGFILMKNLPAFLSDYAPDFIPQFDKYGVARWVWSAIWQEAVVSESYTQFCRNISVYDSVFHMRKLIYFPQFHVSLLSLLYVVNPYAYYLFIKGWFKVLCRGGKKRSELCSEL